MSLGNSMGFVLAAGSGTCVAAGDAMQPTQALGPFTSPDLAHAFVFRLAFHDTTQLTGEGLHVLIEDVSTSEVFVDEHAAPNGLSPNFARQWYVLIPAPENEFVVHVGLWETEAVGNAVLEWSASWV
jgi:hypothetical protein